MSEEKTCSKKLILILTIISLFLSVTAMITSLCALNSGAGNGIGNKKVVISRQYDKGRSLQKAMDTNKPMIVFFYTDWCGFCQRFVPTFDKVTKKSEIKKNFAIAYVNCEKETNQRFMNDYGVDGFPTVFVVDDKGQRLQLNNGILFNDDSVEVITDQALEFIGQ